jgi:hypothetical protein
MDTQSLSDKPEEDTYLSVKNNVAERERLTSLKP